MRAKAKTRVTMPKTPASTKNEPNETSTKNSPMNAGIASSRPLPHHWPIQAVRSEMSPADFSILVQTVSKSGTDTRGCISISPGTLSDHKQFPCSYQLAQTVHGG